MTKTAIITLAIGEAYSERFERLCRRNWQAYAGRHGFDLIVIKDALDTSARAKGRSPAWQKCLILSLTEAAGYERAVWVDSDIVINPAAPSIVEGVPLDLIGVTDEHRFPSPEIRQALLRDIAAAAPHEGHIDRRYWESWRSPGAWHSFVGLPGGQAHIVQTGVMVLSPQHHRGLLEHVYRAYEDENSKLFNYEMRPLSYEIQRHGLQHWIDPKFNALVWWMFLNWNVGRGETPTEAGMKRFLADSYERSHFLHFAGAGNLMSLLGSMASPV